ncbi:DUF6175 family protein [Halosquirtibacter xylanolyticus]|uniref:DUF6175 family protein n=1 Tax=Halosquirtibacter xylanolyticus TaxID=3374599 RepID=UPI003749077C|nr:DUF6175 family protein [Prolixibacteraceae bacterium]
MRRIYIVSAMMLIVCCVYGQAKKPSIMVVPSDDWCTSHDYVMTFDNQGDAITVPDYSKALLENGELNSVISKIGEMMAERDFPLVDLKSQMDKIIKDQARTNMKGVNKSPIDVLNETAKADIVLKVYWKVNQVGPKKSVTFRLQGVDSYTLKQRAAASGTGKQSFTAEVSVLLEEAVLAYLDSFNSQLMSYFEDVFAKGREGALVLLVDEMSDIDFNETYTFKGRSASLKDIINRYWMPRNTVKGRFQLNQNSENVLQFSQVRIPLYGDDGWGGQMAYDFETWGGNLRQFLSDSLQVQCDIQTKGLGEVELTIK